MSEFSELLDLYVERYNALDLDGVMDLYADDAVQLMPEGLFEGKSAIRKRLARDLIAIPDVHHTVRSFVEQGDTFADRGPSWERTPVRSRCRTAPSSPPTGKRVEVKGMELCVVRDGRLIVDNLYYDNMAVLAQLGLIPQPATA